MRGMGRRVPRASAVLKKSWIMTPRVVHVQGHRVLRDANRAAPEQRYRRTSSSHPCRTTEYHHDNGQAAPGVLGRCSQNRGSLSAQPHSVKTARDDALRGLDRRLMGLSLEQSTKLPINKSLHLSWARCAFLAVVLVNATPHLESPPWSHGPTSRAGASGGDSMQSCPAPGAVQQPDCLVGLLPPRASPASASWWFNGVRFAIARVPVLDPLEDANEDLEVEDAQSVDLVARQFVRPLAIELPQQPPTRRSDLACVCCTWSLSRARLLEPWRS